MTEHAAVDDYLALQETRLRLRVRGMRLAADDTGAGFASLRHIVPLAPDYIKVDTSRTKSCSATRYVAVWRVRWRTLPRERV